MEYRLRRVLMIVALPHPNLQSQQHRQFVSRYRRRLGYLKVFSKDERIYLQKDGIVILRRNLVINLYVNVNGTESSAIRENINVQNVLTVSLLHYRINTSTIILQARMRLDVMSLAYIQC